MSGQQITAQGALPWAPVPAAAAALATAFEALSRTSMQGAAPLVVDALAAADMLQNPGENTELRELVAVATGYSALYRQECENRLHREWFADVAQAVECPWCEVDRLQAAIGTAYRVHSGGAIVGEYRTFADAGLRAEAELRRTYPDAQCSWAAHPDVPDLAQLHLLVDDIAQPTGYSVATVTVHAAYDGGQ
ncbi:hypothetical protein [Streptomyces sp. IBSBF 2435]|uniref:hypothetical protein n=1 Tax=Streptomyces sp. IBSBF 2435 TaxID=2903531 RepID=UPI002FDBB967